MPSVTHKMSPESCEALHQYFELVHCDTDELRMQAYQLRYQIYVLETGYERVADCRLVEDRQGRAVYLEQDEFDARSDHFLLKHRRTGLYAATARLILPSPLDIAAPYPIELHCPLDQPINDAGVRTRLGEISRFAVSKEFKRRIGEMDTLSGVAENVENYFGNDERRVVPHISLGLIAAVMRMVEQHHITHCYAVMEPALVRLLSRFNLNFNRIGPDVEYHGIRVPCLATRDKVLSNHVP
jgi:N-acyl amino acid synthase of PEP-CTERM/exosortase system